MISIAGGLRSGARAALAALAIALAGCSDSLVANPDADGLRLVPASPAPYVLKTINGQPLPVEMRNDASGRVSMVQGELLLGGSTFSQRLTLVDTSPAGVATSRESVSQGTIVVNGAEVHFRASDGGEWDGTASPGWIAYTVPGNSGPVTFAFRQN